MPRGVHDHVALGKIFVVACAVDHARATRVIGHRIEHIVGLRAAQLKVTVAKPQLLHRAMGKKNVRHVRAHMTQTDNANLTQASHSGPLRIAIPACAASIRVAG